MAPLSICVEAVGHPTEALSRVLQVSWVGLLLVPCRSELLIEAQVVPEPGWRCEPLPVSVAGPVTCSGASWRMTPTSLVRWGSDLQRLLAELGSADGRPSWLGGVGSI